ncbi:MAG: T9SS type A sorting domain-containing protein [Lewinellaceae bacterium]|nr:T9SS type A sorting domain-containing protein [Lewinellaceae bacterium]
MQPHYLQADILLQAGQEEAAETTLSSIPETFLLTEKQQAEYNNKLALFQLLSGQADIFKLDSLEVIALSDIAQLEGLAAQQARNLLNYAYEGEWEPDHSLPEPTEARLTNIAPENKEPPAFIRAFPNPAREVVTFHYNIPEAVVATVRLFNLMGRPVADIFLQPRSGTKDFDVSALPEGMYAYQLLLGGMVKAAGKVVVLH